VQAFRYFEDIPDRPSAIIHVDLPHVFEELLHDLKAAGFVDRGGKGSHRIFVHAKVRKPVTVSGSEGDDVKHYQEKVVRLAIQESKQ